MTKTIDYYCAAPFRHMIHRSDGKTKPCCLWNDDIWYDNPNLDWGERPPFTDRDPFNHSWMQSLRNAMLSNQRITGCTECHAREQSGYSSLRQSFNETYGRITDPVLRYVEFNLGNLCNLKCRMCDSWSSSKWIADEIALGGNPAPLIRPNIDMIRIDFRNIDKLRFIGGEPTLEQPTMIAILEKILELRSELSHLEVSITTNCTILLEPALIELLSRCKQVEMQCSIDGIGKINDYQRTGSVWEELLTNLLWYQENLSDRFKVMILTSWSIINASSSIEFLEFVIDRLPRYYLIGHLVRDPVFLHICNIPDDMKAVLYAKLAAWTVRDDLYWIQHNKQVIQSQLTTPAIMPAIEVLSTLDRLDKLRKEQFSEVDPIMHAALVNACENTNQA